MLIGEADDYFNYFTCTCTGIVAGKGGAGQVVHFGEFSIITITFRHH